MCLFEDHLERISSCSLVFSGPDGTASSALYSKAVGSVGLLNLCFLSVCPQGERHKIREGAVPGST